MRDCSSLSNMGNAMDRRDSLDGAAVQRRGSPESTVLAGAAVGALGGVIELGGAAFRLPLLIGMSCAVLGSEPVEPL